MKIDKNTVSGRKYYRCLAACLALAVAGLMFCWIVQLYNKVPSAIRVRVGEEQEFPFSIPATADIYKNDEEIKSEISLSRPLSFYADTEETYTMQVNLFGLIPFKETSLSVMRDVELIPVGKPIGIYVHTQGVLVIDTGSFQNEEGKEEAPAEDILMAGDYLLSLNGEPLDGKEELMELLAQGNGEALLLRIKRDREEMEVTVEPKKDSQGEYKLGIWVRDNAQGIGTMTFVDEEGYFGALGHGINDTDTGRLMELREGGLYKTDIISVNKGTPGDPGELSGIIGYAEKNRLGDILQNTARGIYGKVDTKKLDLEGAVPIALKQEIEEGPAQIYCSLSNTPAYYDIEILEVREEDGKINQGLEIQVTDEGLLALTGGIIQGLSGSPIIQNGKLVGAVTHVMVRDPSRGYGIFIEEMLAG